MRLNLNLEELHVETTELLPAYDPESDAYGGYAASVLYDTLTRPIQKPNTNSSPCIA